MWVHELDWNGPGQRQMADACECGNEPSSSVKCGEFLDQLQTSQLLKKDSAPWSINTAEVSKYMFTILNTATFSVHVFYTLLQPNHLSFFLFLALWSIASQQREAVLHIQQQMKVRLPMCSSFTPVDRACSTHKAPICITGTLTVMKSIIFLYCHSSDDLDCQCRNCYLSAVTNI